MKYILITISALLMSCASKPAKDASADAAKSTSTTTTQEAKSDVKKAAKTAAGDVTCTYGDIKRELKVVKSSERCTAEYTKDGSAQEIGTGAPNSTFCSEIIERVKNNLEAAGYKCK